MARKVCRHVHAAARDGTRTDSDSHDKKKLEEDTTAKKVSAKNATTGGTSLLL